MLAIKVHIYVIWEVVIFLMIWFIWRRVASLIKYRGLLSVSSLLKLALLVVLVLAELTWIVGFFFVGSEPHTLSTVCTVCLGSVIFLTTAMIITDVCFFIVRKIIWYRGRGGIQRTTDSSEIKIRTLLSLFCAIILIFSGVVGLSRFTIEEVTIPVKGLSLRLNGTTIIQLSDIHLGPFSGRTELSRIVERVNQLNGDIVVITGDLVDAPVAALREAVRPLATLRSKHGVFYTTGE